MRGEGLSKLLRSRPLLKRAAPIGIPYATHDLCHPIKASVAPPACPAKGEVCTPHACAHAVRITYLKVLQVQQVYLGQLEGGST
eukprot:2328637-Amphidinium_carterae.2